MAHLTNNFTSETPLSPLVQEAITTAFDQGWADPKKQSQASARASILVESAKAEIAQALESSPERLEVIGEPAMVHFIALQGFTQFRLPLYHSTVDVGKIRAVGRQDGDESTVVGVDEFGTLLLDGIKIARGSVLSLQATNGETGATQNLEPWRNHPATIVVDATRSLPNRDLVSGFAATTLDAHSWNGPQGIGFVNINDAKAFKYPLPHIAPIRVPGSYSIPLLVGSAIALTEFKSAIKIVKALRAELADALATVEGVRVLAGQTGSDSRYLSIVVDDISAEEVLRTLLQRDLAIDAGSACSPEDLTPSHVIASMGFPTTGHLRFTLHPHHTSEDVAFAATTLRAVLGELRR